MSNENKVLVGIGAATLLLVIVAVFTLGGKSGLGGSDQDTKPVDIKFLIHSDSHIRGGNNAKVTLVEFGDFQCPACGNAYPIVTQLLGAYGDKVKFVFRNFPLPMHENALNAAEAAEAAGAQGKFFQMYDELYQNQAKWSDDTNVVNDFFVGYAKAIKVPDIARFEQEVKSEKYKAKIEKDQNDGNALNVDSTPTFFINGVRQAGGLPYDDFKAKIDAAMNK